MKTWRNRLHDFFHRSKEGDWPSDELESILFEADLSPNLIQKLLVVFKGIKNKNRENVREILTQELTKILQSVDRPLQEIPTPGAILLLGVNGAGKTTVAAKLANRLKKEGKKVILAAADTFRAGAIEQLKIWGERIEVEVVAQNPGADPGAVIYDAWKRAQSLQAILIADTAGRLHSKKPLVEELKKIVQILKKDGTGAPHECLLVLDGTTGQNAVVQSKEFIQAAPLTGLVLTKMDGTSRGGSAVSSSLELSLPIRYLGIGEKVDDMLVFVPKDFAVSFFQE